MSQVNQKQHPGSNTTAHLLVVLQKQLDTIIVSHS
jgi:hypothetical protein